ncbi:outer envelope protein 61 isoform X3 [Gastrolobium bilobum]|uniref:outer envelope protein 61 isoform X3 n=1 Tax=Gastrolobium bilobum TaxID=150636 RepID=UPI002AAF6E67|nr:outer envelope protein 61 isoform X3 [Gastrolobium bilobum]
MFNGMMDPDMIRMAQQQMSRMSPAELARIQQQMMSNPELMRMASESMKNMSPEDFKIAAEQLKHTRPEEMAEIGEKMANSTPDEVAAMRARVDAQINYQLNAAEMLKKQGNELHNQGRFNDALQKYMLAKENIKDIPSSQSRKLLLACSLNLMSCYLKTRKYDECINEGSEVLAYDANNLKALYRRGQAYKELGLLKDAVTDLSKALEVAPDDDTIAELFRDTKEKLTKGGGDQAPGSMLIEEITEEVENVPSGNNISSYLEETVAQPKKSGDSSKSCGTANNGNPKTNTDSLDALKKDPEAIRSFQNFISSADPAALASLNTGQSKDISPDMIRGTTDMISKMSPEELQKMLDMASSFQGDNPFFRGGSPDSPFNPGSIPPNVTPDMFKTASDMISKMSADDLKNMFEMASSLNGKESIPSSAAVDKNERNVSQSSFPSSSTNGTSAFGESSSSHNAFSNMRNASPSNFPSSSTDLQEQMRNQMKDPAMRQMFTSMFKNMSPEMMANMGEQFGFKLSQEDAAKAQQAMSSLSPESLDKMMLWADRIQRGVEGAKKTKNWLLGKPGMVLAICMLILAIILHRLGFIGR